MGLTCLLGLLCMAACGGAGDDCLIHGQLEGMQGGEVYIYTPQGPRDKIDTLTVREGKFTYQLSNPNTSYGILMFPNFSQQVFFFQKGLEINISGKTNQLRNLRIEGGADNKLMTQFRQQTAEMNADQIAQYCVQFAEKNPTSQVSTYLLQQYLLGATTPYYTEALQVAQLLHQAQPDNNRIEQLLHQTEELMHAQVGQPAPNFEVRDVQGKTHRLSDYKGQPLLLTFGAVAYDGYRELMRSMRDDLKEMEASHHPAMVHLLLDASLPLSRSILYDSIPGANIQELRSFHSPIARQYQITSYPTFILIDKNQRIQMRESEWAKIREKL